MKSFIRIVMVLCAITTHFAISGCGSGGSGGSQNSGVTATSSSNITSPESVGNSYSLTDDYGFQPANFMSTESNNTGGFVLRVTNTEMITPDNSGDIFRIDFLQPSLISVNGGTYSIGDNNENPPFPGQILFFNCNNSGYLITTSGTITFTSFGANSGDVVVGSFDVQMEDRNPSNNSIPIYHVAGNFSFVVNSSGPLSPPSTPL